MKPHRSRNGTPLLSCCLIAKDEAEMLPGCLSSIEGLVDEVVLVDTGSSDRTVEIARAAGARVYSQPFRDDFSAPRNLAVAKARGRWVLVIDADERLAPASHGAIRDAIARGGFDYAMLVLSNASRLDASIEEVLSGQALLQAPQLVARLFKHHDNLEWEGIIHEQTHRWALRGPKRVKRLEQAVIVHYGAVPAYHKLRGKDRRNLSLLEKRCERDPRDTAGRRYLANALHGAGQRDRAAMEIKAAWHTLRGQMDALRTGDPQPGSVSIATLHANYLRQDGELDGAIEVVERALSWNVGQWDENHPNLNLLLGACLETLATRAPAAAQGPARDAWLGRARAAYQRCIAMDGRLFSEAVNPSDCTGLRAWNRLGTVLLLSRDGAAAQQAFSRALDTDDSNLEARLGNAEAALARQLPQQCYREVSAMFELTPPDALTLAALACQAGGAMEPVFGLVKRAVTSLKIQPFVAAHRHRLLMDLCRSLQAVSGQSARKAVGRGREPGRAASPERRLAEAG